MNKIGLCLLLVLSSCAREPKEVYNVIPAGSVCLADGKEVIVHINYDFSEEVWVTYTSEYKEKGLKVKPLELYVSRLVLDCR